MSKELKARIQAAAAKEKRPMANWCAYHLEALLDSMEQCDAAASPAVLEPVPDSAKDQKKKGA